MGPRKTHHRPRSRCDSSSGSSSISTGRSSISQTSTKTRSSNSSYFSTSSDHLDVSMWEALSNKGNWSDIRATSRRSKNGRTFPEISKKHGRKVKFVLDVDIESRDGKTSGERYRSSSTRPVCNENFSSNQNRRRNHIYNETPAYQEPSIHGRLVSESPKTNLGPFVDMPYAYPSAIRAVTGSGTTHTPQQPSSYIPGPTPPIPQPPSLSEPTTLAASGPSKKAVSFHDDLKSGTTKHTTVEPQEKKPDNTNHATKTDVVQSGTKTAAPEKEPGNITPLLKTDVWQKAKHNKVPQSTVPGSASTTPATVKDVKVTQDTGQPTNSQTASGIPQPTKARASSALSTNDTVKALDDAEKSKNAEGQTQLKEALQQPTSSSKVTEETGQGLAREASESNATYKPQHLHEVIDPYGRPCFIGCGRPCLVYDTIVPLQATGFTPEIPQARAQTSQPRQDLNESQNPLEFQAMIHPVRESPASLAEQEKRSYEIWNEWMTRILDVARYIESTEGTDLENSLPGSINEILDYGVKWAKSSRSDNPYSFWETQAYTTSIMHCNWPEILNAVQEVERSKRVDRAMRQVEKWREEDDYARQIRVEKKIDKYRRQLRRSRENDVRHETLRGVNEWRRDPRNFPLPGEEPEKEAVGEAKSDKVSSGEGKSGKDESGKEKRSEEHATDVEIPAKTSRGWLGLFDRS